jgi:hypothetical protein
VPIAMMTPTESVVLYRARWQIELLPDTVSSFPDKS